MSGVPVIGLERLERAAADAPPPRAKRMLIVVNPYATTMSDRLRHLVVYALQGRYDVEAIDTQRKGHAIDLCREAAREDYDVVCAFGGDGTVNEVANGLAGTGIPVTCLPGGATNVFCRMLGIPNDVVDATEHLLRLADEWQPRRVDLGDVNGRCFTFSSGVGLDASVVERVDRHPRLKARYGPFYFAQTAISVFLRHYVVNPPRLVVRAGADEVVGVSAFVQNARPFTYFKKREIELAESVTLDSADLAAAVLRRASAVDVPSVLYRLFSSRARVADHRQVSVWDGLDGLTVTSADGRPFPVEVDGDFVGEMEHAVYRARPGELCVVS